MKEQAQEVYNKISERELATVTKALLKIVSGKNLYTMSEIISCFLNILVDENNIKNYDDRFIRQHAAKMLIIYKKTRDIYYLIAYLDLNKKSINSRDNRFKDISYIQSKTPMNIDEDIASGEEYYIIEEETSFSDISVETLYQFSIKQIDDKYVKKYDRIIKKMVYLSYDTYLALGKLNLSHNAYNKFAISLNNFYYNIRKKNFSEHYSIPYVINPISKNYSKNYANPEDVFIERVKEFLSCQFYISIFINELSKVDNVSYLLENREKNKQNINEWSRVRTSIKRNFIRNIEDFEEQVDRILQQLL